MRTIGWVSAIVSLSVALAQCGSGEPSPTPCNLCAQQACPPTVHLGAFCGDFQVCWGPTMAVQCDGTMVQAAGNCTCPGSSGGGWFCDEVATHTCGGDAGLDGPIE